MFLTNNIIFTHMKDRKLRKCTSTPFKQNHRTVQLSVSKNNISYRLAQWMIWFTSNWQKKAEWYLIHYTGRSIHKLKSTNISCTCMHTRSRVHVNRPTLTQCEEFPKNSLSLLRAPQFLSHCSSPELVVLYLSFRAVLFLVLDLVFLITAPFSLGCFSLSVSSLSGMVCWEEPNPALLNSLPSSSLSLSFSLTTLWECGRGHTTGDVISGMQMMRV